MVSRTTAGRAAAAESRQANAAMIDLFYILATLEQLTGADNLSDTELDRTSVRGKACEVFVSLMRSYWSSIHERRAGIHIKPCGPLFQLAASSQRHVNPLSHAEWVFVTIKRDLACHHRNRAGAPTAAVQAPPASRGAAAAGGAGAMLRKHESSALRLAVTLIHLALWAQLGVVTRAFLGEFFLLGCDGGWGPCLQGVRLLSLNSMCVFGRLKTEGGIGRFPAPKAPQRGPGGARPTALPAALPRLAPLPPGRQRRQPAGGRSRGCCTACTALYCRQPVLQGPPRQHARLLYHRPLCRLLHRRPVS